MKRNNIMLIIQTILMYLAHLPLYIGLILVRMPSNENLDKAIAILFLIGFILTIVILPIALVNLIMALAGAFNKKDNPCKTTMIVKLVLIPWYIMNFLFCVLIFAGFLNPFLFLFAPIVAVILIFNTYILMLSTSIFDIVYSIRNTIKNHLEINASLVFTNIFLFCFCLDIVGSIILYKKSKNIKKIKHH